MKVGNPFPRREVPLPIEVIQLVVAFVDTQPGHAETQQDLWACTLLTTAWYAATIQRLYRSPLLTPKNFDLFTRTICPPVNSHVRSIGLEEFVRNLDMSSLGYESTKSLTARLLRRTRINLQSFIAPSRSFSVACLAPLSKMAHLQYLDLSRDYYDIELAELLRATCDLVNLYFLSAPKGAFRRLYSVEMRSRQRWPTNLTHLQLNDNLPTEPSSWESLISHLPSSVNTLTLAFSKRSGPYNLVPLAAAGAAATQITTLNILHSMYTYLDFQQLSLQVFPNLEALSLPYELRCLQTFFARRDNRVVPHLKLLTLVEEDDDHFRDVGGLSDPASPRDLTLLAAVFPLLKRLELPRRYYDEFQKETSTTEARALKADFVRRWPSEPESEVGVFVDESVTDNSPPWIKNTWGIP